MARSPRRPLLAAVTAVAVGLVGLIALPAHAAEPDLARFGTATASQSQDDVDGSFPASNLIDGNASTRWASGNGPDADVEFTAWVAADLGASATVSGVTLAWESAHAARYQVQVATELPADEAGWTTVHTEDDSAGGAEEITFTQPVEARHVRVLMLEREPLTWDPNGLHWYGYSLFSFEVNGAFAVPSLGFESAAVSVASGSAAEARITLTGPADADQTVRVASGGGTAAAGTDYTAVDELVTIPAGATSASVSVATAPREPLSAPVSFDLTLSEPSEGIQLGARATTTVTVTPPASTPIAGEVTLIEGFESGVPADWFTWAARPEVQPALTAAPDATVPGAPADNDVLVATVGTAPVASDWFGFTRDTPATDWSAADGFQFWWLGTGDGGTLGYEVKSGGRNFEARVVDDAPGWRRVAVLFSDLRWKDDPASAERFDPSASQGFAVTLTGVGGGEHRFDDFALFERVLPIDDMESGIEGWTTVGDGVTLGAETQERGGIADNTVLTGQYQIAADDAAGIRRTLPAAQDWSSFRGIRLWWYASQASNPASPTAGADITAMLEGADGVRATTTFKDNWGSSTSRWKLVELPFSAFEPSDAEAELDLSGVRAFELGFADGTAVPVRWALDDLALYGTPPVEAAVLIRSSSEVYLVDAGDSVDVELSVVTSDGSPLPEDVELSWAGGTGTAEQGVHVDPIAGSTTFDAGSESGVSTTVTVQTRVVDADDVARSIPIELTAEGAVVPAAPRVVINARGLAYLDESLPTEERVADLLERMTLAEKVGQMAQAERLGLGSPQQIADLGLGSILSGGGSTPAGNTPEAWADMIDGYQRQALSTRLQIPLLYGADAVHGHSNVLDATIFPHNIGLGATRDTGLVHDIAEATAVETRATGVNWAFSPCLCPGLDERWGRTYETFGEEAALVSIFAAPAVEGLQGASDEELRGDGAVLGSAKHWAGDGGTRYEPSLAGSGYPIDQGVTHVESVDEFMRLFGDPYIPAIEAGVGTIMPSYSGVDMGEGVVRMHENGMLNNEVLKGELGFEGFLISDWEGIDKLPGGTYAEKAVRSVNGGVDMAMAPYNFGDFITAIQGAVASGAVTEARVDDAVTRILTQKFRLGLFEQPLTQRERQDEIGGSAHRALAREAAAQSQVLLKDDGVLPLADDASIYVAGSNADDLGHQMGGWTISWQGGSGDTTEGTSILEGMREVAPAADITYSRDASAPMAGHDVGLVVVGEPPYAEGVGDVGNNGRSLDLPAGDRAAIDRVCGAMECVVMVVAGRTQLVTDQLAGIDALIAGFLPGSEGAGVADTLFGDTPFTGRLPLTWPATAEQVPINVGDDVYAPLYAYGWGLRTDDVRERIESARDGSPAESAAALQRLLDDVVISEGIADDPQLAFDLLASAAAGLGGGGAPAARAVAGLDVGAGSSADAIVAVARDLAQRAVADGTGSADAQARIADAEHELLVGRPLEAVILLAGVLGIEVGAPDAVATPGAPGTPGGLASTGADAWAALVAALLLLTAGGALALRRRMTASGRGI